MNELKPCPFCGGNTRLITWASTAVSISCIMCGAHFNTYTEAEAIAAWNTRVSDRHPYELRIIGDGSDWGEIMRDAYDDLMASACESCTTEQMEQLVGYIRSELGSGTCEPTEDGDCPYCDEDLIRCDVAVGKGGGAVKLDPPIYHNYCPNCGRKVKEADR